MTSKLSTKAPKTQKLLPPIDPGEILRAEFMEPLRLSMNRALDLRVPWREWLKSFTNAAAWLLIRLCAWLDTSTAASASGCIFNPRTISKLP